MTTKLSPGNAVKSPNFNDEFDRIFGHFDDEPAGIDEILAEECDCGCGLTIGECLDSWAGEVGVVE